MDKYVKADELIKLAQICSLRGNRFGNVMKIYVDACPTADVRPNVRGEWKVYEVANTEEEQPIAWECNNCGEVVGAGHNYCPNCGADMRGEEHDY